MEGTATILRIVRDFTPKYAVATIMAPLTRITGVISMPKILLIGKASITTLTPNHPTWVSPRMPETR